MRREKVKKMIPRELYHATSAEHVNTIEDEERIRPAADGHVYLTAKLDIAIAFAISKGYDRVVVFRADPAKLDPDKLQSIGGGSYLYQGDVRSPALVNRYRTPSPEMTETLAGVAAKIDSWLAILPPEQQGPFLAQLMQQGYDVVDPSLVDAIGRSYVED